MSIQASAPISGVKTDRLDLLSTSQTTTGEDDVISEGGTVNPNVRCIYGAPLTAFVVGGKGFLQQGCCNHWDCPKCGEVRARQEYRRIVHGCAILAGEHKLYFYTVTCRGKDCTIEEAEENYLVWTNRLLTNARSYAQRNSLYWAYVQVTERQKKTRAHPHSHIISTFLPLDAQETIDGRGSPVLVSSFFTRANDRAGLGSQHKISAVKNAAAVSRYVAKYLFKDTFKDHFPPKWKRVRYSQNFPKLPVVALDFSTPLLSPQDWRQVEQMRVWFQAEDEATYEIAKHHIHNVALAQRDVDRTCAKAIQ